MQECWPAYRLVLERYVSLADLDRLSLDDVDLMCLALDAWQDAERKQYARAAKKGRHGR